MDSHDYDSYTPEENNFTYILPEEEHHLPMFQFVIYNIQLFVFYPIILIANLLLFIKIVGNEKIRSEPWRWLIAQNSICTIIAYLISYDYIMSALYHTPTLQSTPLCPAQKIINENLWYMTIISVVLLITERFHTVRTSKENNLREG